MSGIVLALAGATYGDPPPTVIGQAYGGGFYAGQIGVSGVATHYLIIGPVASAQSSTTLKVKNANTAIPGSGSDIDGPQNTADMVADGNSTVYPAAHFCNDLVTGGQTDWYMPAKNELEICYYLLKPGTRQQFGIPSGINPNAIPPRASAYTATNPLQTSATNFQTTGTEDFGFLDYWTSTEFDTTKQWRQNFYYGQQDTLQVKDAPQWIRAVRRVAV